MNPVIDTLLLRRPKIDYLSPAICEAIFSSTGFPIIILNDIGKHPGPTGLVIGGVGHNRFSWDAYPGALCYNIYSAVFDVTNITECEQLVAQSETVTYEIIAECYAGTSFVIPHQGCYRVSAITPDGESDLSAPTCSCNFTPVTPVQVCNTDQTATCPPGQVGTPVTIHAGTYCIMSANDPDSIAAAQANMNAQAQAQAQAELSCTGTGCDGPNWDSMSWVLDNNDCQGEACFGGGGGVGTIGFSFAGANIFGDINIPGGCAGTAPCNAFVVSHGDIFYTGPGGTCKMTINVSNNLNSPQGCRVILKQDGVTLASWNYPIVLADQTLGDHVFNFSILGGIASNVHIDVYLLGDANQSFPQHVTFNGTLANVC